MIDERQREVTGLTHQDFAVYEDGWRQEMRFFVAAPTLRTSMALSAAKVEGDFSLRTLAQQTGGQASIDLAQGDIASTCRRIANELANQYSLGYVSSPRMMAGSGWGQCKSQAAAACVPGRRGRMPAWTVTRPGYGSSALHSE